MPVTTSRSKSINVKKKPIVSLTKKLKLYHVIWRDAFTEEDIWHDAESIKSEDYICETVGFLIEDNNKPNYITIASTATHDEYFCSVINIPKSMIIKKTALKISGSK
jgi:hypothetical protein